MKYIKSILFTAILSLIGAENGLCDAVQILSPVTGTSGQAGTPVIVTGTGTTGDSYVELYINNIFKNDTTINTSGVWSCQIDDMAPGKNVVKALLRRIVTGREQLTWSNEVVFNVSPYILKVNFQPTGFVLPPSFVSAGYVTDAGTVMQSHGSYCYGWNLSTIPVDIAGSCTIASATDERYRSYCKFADSNGNRWTWEVEVPDGFYDVRVVVGGLNQPTRHRIVFEEHTFLDEVTDGTTPWHETTLQVAVTDGRLTLKESADGTGAQICFLELTQTGSSGGKYRYRRGAGQNLALDTFVASSDYLSGVQRFGTAPGWENNNPQYEYYHYNSATNANDIRINGPIVYFGSTFGGDSLYTGRTYDFSLYAGWTIGQPYDGSWLGAFFIVVKDKKTGVELGRINFNELENYIEADNGHSWDGFRRSGYFREYNNIQYGIKTTVYKDGVRSLSLNGGDYTYNNKYTFSHVSTRDDLVYEVYASPMGTLHAEGETTYHTAVRVYDNINKTWDNGWNHLYTISFEKPPVKIDTVLHTKFDNNLLPSVREGKIVNSIDGRVALDEMFIKTTSALAVQNCGIPNGYSTILTPSLFCSAGGIYLQNNVSPELRYHTELQKLINNHHSDPLALANYIMNEIELTDYVDYNEGNIESEASLDIGGLRRSAYGTYIEGRGSPLEQCALLIYCLRACGVPCGYVFPERGAIKLEDERLGNLIGIPVAGRRGTPRYVPVNYPWVLAYLDPDGPDGAQGPAWVHLFPWLKDYENIRGYDLYSLMPEEYNNGFKWAYQFLYANPEVMMQDTGDAYMENAGMVVIEAEYPWEKVEKSAHRWTLHTIFAGYSGSGYMTATPNIDECVDAGSVAKSPRLDYEVDFSQPGTYYVWVRGNAEANSNNNTVHLGVNGATVATADEIQLSTSTRTWQWTGTDAAAARCSIHIPSAGRYTINLWMMKDGAMIDRLLLTNNASFTPTGVGPAESKGRMGDRRIGTVGKDSDQPSVLWPAFMEKKLKETYPAITMDSVGLKRIMRKYNRSNWLQFPVPDRISGEATLYSTMKEKPLIYDTLKVELIKKYNNNIYTVIDTGEIPICDLNNRAIYFTKNSSNLTLTIGGYDEYDPDQPVAIKSNILYPAIGSADYMAKGGSQFTYTGSASSSYTVEIRTTQKRHRDWSGLQENMGMQRYDVPDTYVWNSFKYNQTYGSDNEMEYSGFIIPLNPREYSNSFPFIDGEYAYSMNLGTVSKAMLDQRSKELWRYEEARKRDINPIAINKFIARGYLFSLIGMDYFKKTSTFEEYLDQKNGSGMQVSAYGELFTGLKMASGETFPAISVYTLGGGWFSSEEIGASGDNGKSSASIISVANSAAEHAILEQYYTDSEGYSAVKLLQKASLIHRENPDLHKGIVELKEWMNNGTWVKDWVNQGEVSYKIDGESHKLKNWDSGLWDKIITHFDYTASYIYYLYDKSSIGFIPAGPVCIGNIYAMGVMPFSPWGGAGGYISGNLKGGESNAVNTNEEPELREDGDGEKTIKKDSDGKAINDAFDKPSANGTDGSEYPLYILEPMIVTAPVGYELSVDTSSILAAIDGMLAASEMSGISIGEIFSDYGNTGVYLGQNNPDGQQNSETSDPINVVTGEFYVDTVDLSLEGLMPFEIRRNYSSKNTLPDNLGYGWRLSFASYLVMMNNEEDNIYMIQSAELDGTVQNYMKDVSGVWRVIPNENGSASNYSANGIGSTNNCMEQYITKADEDVRLDDSLETQELTVYTMHMTDGRKRRYVVREFPLNGLNRQRPYLLDITDKSGNWLRFIYGTDYKEYDYGQVKRVDSSNGNWLSYKYDSKQRIVEAFCNDSRRVSYEYTECGDLWRVVLPDGTQEKYDYKTTDGEWLRYNIPVGRYFTGTMTKLVLISDQGKWDTETQASFRNVKIYTGEQNRDEIPCYNFTTANMVTYAGGENDTVGITRIRNENEDYATTGPEIDFHGNSWKAFALLPSIVVNENTIISFEIKVRAMPKICAIGLDDNLSVNSPRRYFWICGTGAPASYDRIEYAGNYGKSTHLLVRSIKPDGRVLENNYDSERRVIEQRATVGPEGQLVRTVTCVYNHEDAGNGLDGWTRVYNLRNQPSSNPAMDADCTLFEYTDGLIERITDEHGNTIEQEWYHTRPQLSDANPELPPDLNANPNADRIINNLTSLPSNWSNTSPGGYPRSIKRIKDKSGLVTYHWYDSHGNLILKKTIGDVTGDGIDDVVSESTEYGDPNNNYTLPTRMLSPAMNDVGQREKVISYDSNYSYNPSIVSEQVASLEVARQETDYDDAADLTRFANGLPITLRRGIGGEVATQSVAYTPAGHPYQVTQYAPLGASPSSQDVHNMVENFRYDTRGNIVERINDALGRRDVFDYDLMNRPIRSEVYDSSSQRVSAVFLYYTANGELSWMDGERSNPEDYVFRDYDSAGRVIAEMVWLTRAKADGSGVEALPGQDDMKGQAITTYDYDGSGNLLQKTDPSGNYTKYEYDDLNQLTRQVSHDGKSNGVLGFLNYYYEPGGQIEKIVDSEGGITRFEYTDAGAKKMQINPDGTTQHWEYYLDGRVSKEIMVNGSYMVTLYDQGTTKREIHRKTYNREGTLLGVAIAKYDSRGNLVCDVNMDGYAYEFEHDGLDRPVRAWGPPRDGVAASRELVVETEYLEGGKVIKTTNALNQTISKTVDVLGRPVNVETRDASNLLVARTGYLYDPDHHWVESIRGDVSETTIGAKTIRTRTHTDTLGHPVLTMFRKDALPTPQSYDYIIQRYDLAGNLVISEDAVRQQKRYEYDGLNRIIASVMPDGARTEFSYDTLGHLTRRSMPGGMTLEADYDPAGRLMEEKLTHSGAVSRHFTYKYYQNQSGANSMPGALLERNDRLRGLKTTYREYDALGRIKSMELSGNASTTGMSKNFTYDLRGNLESLRVDYKSAAYPSTEVLRNYDGYSRTVNETVKVNEQIVSDFTNGWDAAGRRENLQHGNQPLFGYGYRADGLMNAVTEHVTTQNRAFQYSYSRGGLLLTRSNPWRTLAVRNRDARGRVIDSAIYSGSSATGTPFLVETAAWRPDDKLSNYDIQRTGVFSDSTPVWSETGASSRAYSYNSRGQLTAETFSIAAAQQRTFDYGFDADKLGVLTGASVTNLTRTTQDYRWSIPNGRLDGFARPTEELIGGKPFAMSGNAPGADSVDLTISLMDSQGTSVVESWPLNEVDFNALDSEGNWSANVLLQDGRYRLTAHATHSPTGREATTSHDFTIQPGSQFDANEAIRNEFDRAGFLSRRVLAGGVTQEFLWDAAGRLVEVRQRGGSTPYDFVCIYDGLGRRIRTERYAIVGGVRVAPCLYTDSKFDPLVWFLEIGVSLNGGATQWKVYGPDLNGVCGGLQGIGGLEMVIDDVSKATTAVASDVFGNIIATNAGATPPGTWIWKKDVFTGYGPAPSTPAKAWGTANSTTETTSLTLAIGWHGYRIDPTGMYWMGARHYDPKGGRFISPDPLGHGASMDLYSYTNGDPINFSDPTGLCAKMGNNPDGVVVLKPMEVIGKIGYNPAPQRPWPNTNERPPSDNIRGIERLMKLYPTGISENSIRILCKDTEGNKILQLIIDNNITIIRVPEGDPNLEKGAKGNFKIDANGNYIIIIQEGLTPFQEAYNTMHEARHFQQDKTALFNADLHTNESILARQQLEIDAYTYQAEFMLRVSKEQPGIDIELNFRDFYNMAPESRVPIPISVNENGIIAHVKQNYPTD